MLRLSYRWWRLAPREIASCCRGRKASGSHGGRLGWQKICTKCGAVVGDGRWMIHLLFGYCRGLDADDFSDAMQKHSLRCDESICNLFWVVPENGWLEYYLVSDKEALFSGVFICC